MLGTYKLVISWFGEPSFYEVIGEKIEQQPSETDAQTVRFWLNEKDREDSAAGKGGGIAIDRQTLKTGLNRSKVLPETKTLNWTICIKKLESRPE